MVTLSSRVRMCDGPADFDDCTPYAKGTWNSTVPYSVGRDLYSTVQQFAVWTSTRRVDIDDYYLGEVTAGGTVLCTLGPEKEVLIEQAKARWR